MNKSGTAMSRRQSLAMAGGLLLAGSASSLFATPSQAQQEGGYGQQGSGNRQNSGGSIVSRMENALGAQGDVRHGVLMVSIGRKDIGNVSAPMGVTFTPDFEIHHDFAFQMIGNGMAMGNGELAILPHEADGVIGEIVNQGLVFQAFHQHFVSENPQVFHIHLRGKNEPVRLAESFRRVVEQTGTPMPQQKPGNQQTPLNPQRLARIIGGDAYVGGGGVVHVMVPRAERIQLGGVEVNPYLAIMSHIAFKPMPSNNGSGSMQAAVAPDFGMLAHEVNPLMKVMLNHGFHVNCLYNQETDEHPQLFWSHQLNVGDPEQLAHAVRDGLEQTRVNFQQGMASR